MGTRQEFSPWPVRHEKGRPREHADALSIGARSVMAELFFFLHVTLDETPDVEPHPEDEEDREEAQQPDIRAEQDFHCHALFSFLACDE
jgi:hypothetical protein